MGEGVIMAFFGPAGNSESFFAQGYKKTLEIPTYLNNMGLNAFEYQCGRGVNIGQDKCQEFGKKAKEQNIKLSLHAPYYISMSSMDEEKRLNSINYILQSANAANAMGADRIIVHTGSIGKFTREEALFLAKDTMQKAIAALKENNLYNIRICPETMGKINQLGNLYEVLEICKLDENLIPCIDFGHLNARTLGGLSNPEDFEEIFENMKNAIGESRMKEYHSHFSKIEYTKGGEKKHLTFSDTVFGPSFEYMLEAAYKYGANPTVICESAGTQAEDAKAMLDFWKGL